MSVPRWATVWGCQILKSELLNGEPSSNSTWVRYVTRKYIWEIDHPFSYQLCSKICTTKSVLYPKKVITIKKKQIWLEIKFNGLISRRKRSNQSDFIQALDCFLYWQSTFSFIRIFHYDTNAITKSNKFIACKNCKKEKKNTEYLIFL